MGIPSLFRTLVAKYPNIHYWDADVETDHLYLDYNCLIHHCKSTFVSSNQTNARQYEEEFITHIINYTSHIVCDIVKPKKLVYIAIDGPVPMTKVMKQRARRYKKVQDCMFHQKLCEKYNVEPETSKFESNKITPGTTFMSKLCSRIKNFIMLGTFSRHLKTQNKKFSVFLSDSNIAGEGEQKIYEFMKNNKGNPASVIYGLDADLIVLSLKNSQSHIKLLREPQNTSLEIMQCHSNNEFIYFDIAKCKECLLVDYNLKMYDHNSIIHDIIFLTFFGGNDFVDSFVHTKMKDNGFDKLLSAYKRVLAHSEEHLIHNDKINYNFVKQLCFELSSLEDVSVKKTHASVSSRCIPITRKTKTTEAILIEMSRYEHSYYIEKQNPFHDYYANVVYSIDFNCSYETWKKQYNKYYFGNEDISDVCQEYLKILDWNWKYYTTNEAPDWLYYYPYNNAPLCSDLYDYMNGIDCTKIVHKYLKTQPLCPFMQLLIVLPPQNANLLPFSFHKILMNLIENGDHHFPKKFKLDVVKGMKNIYSEPILPKVDFEYLQKILITSPLSEPEYIRNVVRKKPFFFRY